MDSGRPVPRCNLGDQLLELPDALGPNIRSVCWGTVRQSTMLPACGVTQGPRRRGQRMPADYSICLGTAGWGVWHSPDAGKSWMRHRAPFPLNSRIQALVAHPKEAHTVLAGGDTGLFVSHNSGARWERISVNGGHGANE